VLLLVALGDGDVVRDIPLMLNVCIVPVVLGMALELVWPVFMLVLAADFLSVWRLFWNQMVTDFISL
jgi:hypothetical protein